MRVATSFSSSRISCSLGSASTSLEKPQAACIVEHDLQAVFVKVHPRIFKMECVLLKEKQMDLSRKANREANEITLQYKSRQEILLDEELSEDKLTQLLAFIGQFEQTPLGAADLQIRRRLFGECKRIEGETSAQFHVRLRYWLDRDIPQTKSPLHAPRQTGE
jgi:hypothetical protein